MSNMCVHLNVVLLILFARFCVIVMRDEIQSTDAEPEAV